jgi:outer membrane immunogenic protein
MLNRISLTILAMTMTGSAMAADLSTKPVVTSSAVNWTGLYTGASLGGDIGFVRGRFLLLPTSYRHQTQGINGGLQLGYLQQFNQFVAGAELGASFMTSHGSTNCPNSTFICKENAVTLYEASGILGYAFDQSLIYGKVGYGFESIASTSIPSFPTYTDHRNVGGLLLGIGAKYEVMKNVDVGLEYINLGLSSKTFSPASPTQPRSISGDDNIVRATISYRFNFGN